MSDPSTLLGVVAWLALLWVACLAWTWVQVRRERRLQAVCRAHLRSIVQPPIRYSPTPTEIMDRTRRDPHGPSVYSRWADGEYDRDEADR